MHAGGVADNHPYYDSKDPLEVNLGSTRFALCESSDQMAPIQIAQKCNFIQTELTVKQMLR